jgi:hypothetical protein
MRLKAAVLVAAVALGHTTPASAQTPAPPGATATGETGLFNLLSAETLPDRGWSFSLYYNNWDRLIDLHSFITPDALEYDRDRLSASVGYGITQKWEVAVQVPFYEDFTYRHDRLLLGQELDVNGTNNIRIGTNFQLFHSDNADSSASINGFVEVPTGDSELASDEHGFGVTGAARLRRFVFNFGYRDPGDDEDFDNPQEIVIGGGYARPVSDRLQWMTELISTTEFGGQTEALDVRPALDLSSGIRLLFPNSAAPWALNAALRVNVNGLSGVGAIECARCRSSRSAAAAPTLAIDSGRLMR